MELQIPPKKVLKLHLICIGILFVFNAIAVIAKYGFGDNNLHGFSRLVFLNAESNLPTAFSAFIILINAFILFVITIHCKNNGRKFLLHWTALSFIFLFLAFDEIATIHETLNSPLRRELHATGPFYFAWVIPALIALPLLYAFYYKFLKALPQRIGMLCTVAGGVYISGCLGFEMIGAYIRWLYNETTETMSLLYTVMTTIEESLEMLGMAIFLYALLSLLPLKVKEVSFKVLT